MFFCAEVSCAIQKHSQKRALLSLFSSQGNGAFFTFPAPPCVALARGFSWPCKHQFSFGQLFPMPSLSPVKHPCPLSLCPGHRKICLASLHLVLMTSNEIQFLLASLMCRLKSTDFLSWCVWPRPLLLLRN